MVRAKNTRIRKTADEKVVSGLALFIVTVVALACLLPFLRVVAQAFSLDKYVMAGEIVLLPKGFTLKHMNFILSSNQFTSSLWLSVFSTAVFTVIALLLTVLTAYPLSRMYLGGRKQFTFFIVFTMLFNGGMMPTYLVVRMLGVTNTFWALIVPCAISAYNTIILITTFRTIPAEFDEAARVDGAGHFRILFTIMLPLAKPTLAVLLLWYAVFRWNSWFDAMMYINKTELTVLPLVVRNIINRGNDALQNAMVRIDPSPTVAVQSAAVAFSILPILVLYPFLQNYFVKGVMIGGIKG